jgi:parvulin-like peptidyl-prolyl isomerase
LPFVLFGRDKTRGMTILALLAMPACLCFLATAQAQTQEVAASVNGEAITESAVIQHIRLTELLTHAASTWPQALDELIDGVVTLQAATRKGVAPTDAEVEAALADICRGLHVTPDQLTQTLAQEGVSIAALKLRLKFDLASQRIFAGARFEQLPAPALNSLRELRRGAVIEMK